MQESLNRRRVAARVRALHRKERQPAKVYHYPDGWVPNAYRWKAPGLRHEWPVRDGRVAWSERVLVDIDRKRPNGRGPKWAVLTPKGGRLYSEV